MRILFQYFTGGGGGLSNIILLLQAISRNFPNDHLDILCSPSSDLFCLDSLNNVNVIAYGGRYHQEYHRLCLGYYDIKRISLHRKSDIIWSLNYGSYIRTNIPQVLSIHNAHQVYPWAITRYHPDSSFNIFAIRWFFRKSLYVADGAIVQTEVMGKLVEKIRRAPIKIEAIPKAVEDDNDIVPLPLSNKLEKCLRVKDQSKIFTFLYVATAAPHKNHITLIKAFRILASQSSNIRVVFTLNEEQFYAIAAAEDKELLDKGYIVLAGWVKKPFLKSLYDYCDACLMPSIIESLSSAHLEAMKWGKPQIVSDLPYSRDICCEAAIYAQAEDAMDWVMKIKCLVNDDFQRNRLIKAGYSRMDMFPKSWDEVAIRVRSFLDTIIERKVKIEKINV